MPTIIRIKGTEYTAIIEKGEDGYFIGILPSIHGCHTQAKTLRTLNKRLREAALLCLMS